MNKGHADYLGLAVLNDDTGAIIVPELVHGHQTKWEVRGPQQGMPGSSTLGTFKVVAAGAPYSPEFRRNKSQWDLIQANWANEVRMRVEGYLGGRVTGQPRFSGIITDMLPALDTPWEIDGVDSLWLLQQSQVLPGETIILGGPGLSAGFSAHAFFGTNEVVLKDDFSKWSSGGSSNYHLTGSFSQTTDPLFGLPAIVGNGTSDIAITNTTWALNAQWSAATVTLHGVVNAPGPGVSSSTGLFGPGVFVFSDSTSANSVLADLVVQQVSALSGSYNLSLRIGVFSGGTYTQQAVANNLFTNLNGTFPFELTVILSHSPSGPGGQQFFYKAILNGNDPNVTSGVLPAGPPAAGGVGFRHADTVAGFPSYLNRLEFIARTSGGVGFPGFGTNRFAFGNSFSGASVGQSATGQGQTHLDVLQLASTFDNVAIRKDPGAGNNSDVINYGGGPTNPNPGTDFSASVVLREGVNIEAQDTRVASVPELLGTDVRYNSLPGADSGGSATWGKIGNPGDTVLIDTIADVGIPGFMLLVNYARAIQARRVNPLQAVQARVVRDDRWIGAPGTNGAGPREWDSVAVEIPTINVPMQVAQIVGYDFEEGAESMVVYFNQLPRAAAPLAPTQRFQRQLDNLGTTYKPR